MKEWRFIGYTELKTTGQYKVKETQAILIDKSRLETNENDGSNREIPIHFYYPESDTAMTNVLVIFILVHLISIMNNYFSAKQLTKELMQFQKNIR